MKFITISNILNTSQMLIIPSLPMHYTCYETRGSLQHSQEPATGPCPHSDEPSPESHSLPLSETKTYERRTIGGWKKDATRTFMMYL
jgi:hypothetical protein